MMTRPTKKTCRLKRELADSADYLRSIGGLDEVTHARITEGTARRSIDMTDAGKRLVQAANEALAIAKGQADPSTYVVHASGPPREPRHACPQPAAKKTSS